MWNAFPLLYQIIINLCLTVAHTVSLVIGIRSSESSWKQVTYLFCICVVKAVAMHINFRTLPYLQVDVVHSAIRSIVYK